MRTGFCKRGSDHNFSTFAATSCLAIGIV